MYMAMWTWYIDTEESSMLSVSHNLTPYMISEVCISLPLVGLSKGERFSNWSNSSSVRVDKSSSSSFSHPKLSMEGFIPNIYKVNSPGSHRRRVSWLKVHTFALVFVHFRKPKLLSWRWKLEKLLCLKYLERISFSNLVMSYIWKKCPSDDHEIIFGSSVANIR